MITKTYEMEPTSLPEAPADSLSASLDGFLKNWELFASVGGNWGQGRNLHCAHFRPFQILKNNNVLLILTHLRKQDSHGRVAKRQHLLSGTFHPRIREGKYVHSISYP